MVKRIISPMQTIAVEVLIAEQLECGCADIAVNLATSIGRRLTTFEIDHLLEYYMSEESLDTHIYKMSDMAIYGSSMPMYIKVINLAATLGKLSIVYNMSANCGRKMSQFEVDLVYLYALKNESGESFAKSIRHYLYFDTMKSISLDSYPSKEVAELLLRKLIDENQLEIAESLVWILFLHKKEQVSQYLIDELVNLMYANKKGWSFFAISSSKDVIHLASISVISNLLDDYLTISHEPLRLFEFASCDKSGELTSRVIKILIEDSKIIYDPAKKASFLRSIVQIVLNSVYSVTITIESASELTLYLLSENLWAASYSIAVNFTLDKVITDRIMEVLILKKGERDTDEYILTMYRKYGANDNIRDLLIKSFSNNVFYNRRLPESVEIVAELGGTASLDYLTLDLLSQLRDSFAVDVAKNKLVSPLVREKVIERAIIAFSSLDFVSPLVRLNKRALRKDEIHAMLRLNIETLKTYQGRLNTYAECAIELLRYKASAELVPDLMFALKERNLTTYYVDVSLMTGVKID